MSKEDKVMGGCKEPKLKQLDEIKEEKKEDLSGENIGEFWFVLPPRPNHYNIKCVLHVRNVKY